jgi:hypothetical protein
LGQAGLKKRCVIVKPAGRQISAREIAWYDTSFHELIERYFNTGDMAVYDSTLKLLDFSDSYALNIDLPVDRIEADHLSRNFDYIVLRGSNYIHEGMEWGYFIDWLEAVQLPVLCVGVGAQASEQRRMELPESGRRLWQIIGERSHSVGVRGEYTAAVLDANGVKNAEVVGCPTIFRHRQPAISLRHKEFEAIQKVGFSLRRETDHTYSSDVERFLSVQKNLILRANRVFDLILTSHGEIEEKVYYYNDFTRIEWARRTLTNSGWFDPQNINALETIYRSRLFFSTVTSHYDELVSALDFTFGYRVHGVLPALAAGTPSFLLSYDTRSAELARSLKVPIVEPDVALNERFDVLFHRDRFADFEAHYPFAYDRMRAFLKSNEIAHLMH